MRTIILLPAALGLAIVLVCLALLLGLMYALLILAIDAFKHDD